MSLSKVFETKHGVVHAAFHTIITTIEKKKKQQWSNYVVVDNQIVEGPSTFLELDQDYTQEVADELAYRLTPEGTAEIAERVEIIKQALLAHERDKFEQLFDDSEDF